MNNYYDNLPKKNMAAGALIFNNLHQLLIVKPSYKDHWSIPGGVVELNESPYEACIRETYEEVGLVIKPTKMLVISYIKDESKNRDALLFIFNSDIVINSTSESEIKLQEKEIEAYKFVNAENIHNHLSNKMSQIVMQVIDNYSQGIYLENIKPIE